MCIRDSLRPGTVLGANSKLGAFCEAKNSQIGQDAKVPHLTYVGDAEIGEGANIGAGSIFANYNGVTKNRTVIGAHTRMGSGGIYVAPVTVGDGAYSGAGALIRKDVPAGALAISETSQRNIDDWVLKNREEPSLHRLLRPRRSSFHTPSSQGKRTQSCLARLPILGCVKWQWCPGGRIRN